MIFSANRERISEHLQRENEMKPEDRAFGDPVAL